MCHKHSPTASKTIESNHALRFRDLEGDAAMKPSGRRLQDKTTVSFDPESFSVQHEDFSPHVKGTERLCHLWTYVWMSCH